MNVAKSVASKSRTFEKILTSCRDILLHEPMAAEARDYLDSRMSREAQERHGFGFFPPDDGLMRLIDAVGNRVLKQRLLVYPKVVSGARTKHGHFHYHNIVMPFKDVHGHVVSMVGRTLLSSDDQKEVGIPKYKYSFGANKQLYLYGMDRAKDAIIAKDFVICVEGQMDCIACHEVGIMNVVACGGANLLPIQFFQLRRYTNNLVLLLDNDDAGKTARDRIKRRYEQHANVGVMTPPGGFKDIDELLRGSTEERRQHIISVLDNLYTQINREKNGGQNKES